MLFIIIIVVGLGICLLLGNIGVIMTILEGGSFADEGFWIIILCDICLVVYLFKKYSLTVLVSFLAAIIGYLDRFSPKEKIKELEESEENEELYRKRLEELRNKRVCESATVRTFHFCQLIEMIAGKEQLQDCMAKVNEKKSVLDEIDNIESKILEIAEGYKEAKYLETSIYYLNMLKAKKESPKAIALEKECRELQQQRDEESRAMRIWRNVFLVVLLCLAVFISWRIYQACVI